MTDRFPTIHIQKLSVSKAADLLADYDSRVRVLIFIIWGLGEPAIQGLIYQGLFWAAHCQRNVQFRLFLQRTPNEQGSPRINFLHWG